MKFKKVMISCILLTAIALVSFGCGKKPAKVQNPPVLKFVKIIPLPKKEILTDSVKTISENSTIYVNSQFIIAGKVIINAIKNMGGFVVEENNGQANDCDIQLVLDEKLNNSEYKIDINNKKILLRAKSPRSAFYAAQTFRQILWTADKNESGNKIKIQGIIIDDQPQYQYRGFMIDLARHLFPKKFIFKIIDQMALYKLNKLQLHLSDDQGWRIQIDKYPKLTSVGAFRKFDSNDKACIEKAKSDPDYHFNPQFVNGNIYGGFYTKQDIRDIVSYAAKHYVDIIPEIDMPGHMSAAIRAYPQLSCTRGTGWGKEFSEPLCICKPEVMQFVRDIWDEVINLFPYDTVHIGADEVEKSFWEKDKLCKLFMENHSLNNANELQSYFVDNIDNYLSSKRKKVIAWDDIFVNNNDNIVNSVNSNIIITYWRDYKPESAVYAAQNGNSIILSPWSWFYLSSDPTDKSLKSLYDYNEKSELNSEVISKVIGYQACVWTEEIPSEAVFERYIFPRFQAYAEVAWTSTKAWQSFIRRMDVHLEYLRKNGIKYTKSKYFN